MGEFALEGGPTCFTDVLLSLLSDNSFYGGLLGALLEKHEM